MSAIEEIASKCSTWKGNMTYVAGDVFSTILRIDSLGHADSEKQKNVAPAPLNDCTP